MKKPSIFGKYLLLERINVGGMAEVFIAKAFGVEGFERILAIKKILPTMAADEDFISMFIDEARISVQLNHANIVHIHELGKYQETYFIAMEYVAGRDVRSILEWYRRRKERMPIPQALLVASRVCEGLDYAHRKRDARGVELGIIHRDISPQNILVSFEGEVKLIDFGIAKAANRSQKTQAGILKGKFGYMSPEQVRGLPIDRRSDVFAVGTILYELLTGEKLFHGESDFSTLEKVRNAVVPSPNTLGIPEPLVNILLRALAREPDDRYQWASDLHEDLMRFLVSSDAVYTAKHLSAFMKDAFAEDLLREEEKMQRFAALERPEELETSSVAIEEPRPGRRNSPAPMPAVTQALEDTQVPPQPARLPSPGPGRQLLAEVDDSLEQTQLVNPDEEGSASGLSLDGRTQVTVEPPAMLPPSLAALNDVTPVTRLPLLVETTQTQMPPEPVRARSGNRHQVVIGQAHGYSGETVVGPMPAETLIGPAPQADSAVRNGKASSATDETGPSYPAPRLGRERSTQDMKLRRGRARASARVTAAVVFGKKRVVLAIAGGLAAFLLAFLAVLLLSARKPINVVISVSPADRASILVDGLRVQNKVLTPLSPGMHEVLATAPGYKPHRRKLKIESRMPPTAVQIILEPEPEAEPFAPASRTNSDSIKTVPHKEEASAEKIAAQHQGVAAPAAHPPPVVPAPPAQPKTFSAKFVSSESGVGIWLDGKRVGKTPGVSAPKLDIERSYRYEARRAGFKPAAGELRYDGRAEQEIAIRLERLPPEEKPARAAPKAVSKATLKREEAARSVVAASAPAAKVKPRGRLACSSNPPFADVYVDGKFTGRQTPVPLNNSLELPVGAHKVTFKLGAKSSEPQPIDVKENEITTLRNVPVE